MSTGANAGGLACSCTGECTCACEPAPLGNAGYEEGAAATARPARELFKDEYFPVEEPTLAGDVPEGVIWRRPHELCKNPQVFVDGASRLDVLQGANLGDCWLIAACSALAEHKNLIKELIPDGLELKTGGSENKYTGKVTIRLWASGSRFDMIIDDRLPVMKTKDGLKLVYGACKDTSEFWLPLVEKAVAKYQGGYRNLRGRQIAEGLMILTGYSVNRIDLVQSNTINNLYKFLRKELARKSLVVAAGNTTELIRISTMVLENRRDGEENAKKSVYHSYTVNKVMLLSNSTPVFRIRNPWGTETDCTGKFRISPDLLNELSAETAEELLQCPCSDGEYWVDEKGFYKKFLELCVANKYPSVSRKQLVPSANVVSARGIWDSKTAGGPPGCKTFENNCQFLFQVDIVDKESVKGNVPVLLEIIQDLHRASSLPYKSGMQIYKLVNELATWQAVGAPQLQRYSWAQLRASSYAQSAAAAACGTVRSCAVRGFVELVPLTPYVAVAWAPRGLPPVHFLLRVYSPHGVVVRMRPLPDPR